MKLYCASEVPADTHELICRESRLAGVLRFIVWCVVLSGPIIYGWQFNYPWVMWLFMILFVIIIPLMLNDVIAQFSATNWLLRIRSDGVGINLTSYRDKVSEGVTVVWLDYREIASAGRHTESYSTPTEITGPASHGSVGGETFWRDVFLEFRLNHEQTSELQAALSHLRSQAASRQLPAGQSQFRRQHFPVWLVEPAVLRLTWSSSHRVVIAPQVDRALARLKTYIRLAEPTHRKRSNWGNLVPQDVDELARELVHVHGAYSEAAALLVRAGGFTDSAARTLVQQFEDEGSSNAARGPKRDLSSEHSIS